MQSVWPALQKLESETFLNIIVGDTPVSSFDTFVAEWKRQGGDQITQEVNVIVKSREAEQMSDMAE